MLYLPNGATVATTAGHLSQGRYKAILVDAYSYLLELARYAVLNPVRSHMVDSSAKWPWSSYQAVTGEVDTPAWLKPDGLLAQFWYAPCASRGGVGEVCARGGGR